MTVSAVNSYGGVAGSFTLTGGGGVFVVSYDHPLSAGATTVGANASAGFVWGTDQSTYSGHDVVATLNLYQGVRANDDGGYAAPLLLLDQEQPEDNCQDFVNSLFGPGMRSAAVVEEAFNTVPTGGYVPPADFSGGQVPGFVEVWARHWLGGDSSQCPAQDAALLDLLATHVSAGSGAGPLTLWVPQIARQGSATPPTYLLSGYRGFSFRGAGGSWDSGTVQAFLSLLAGGAHFVSVCATADLPAGVSATPLDTVLADSGLPTSRDIGSSHYTSAVNITGTYYLSIGEDFAPAGCGLLLAFLVGRTVNNPLAQAGAYNAFFQLEGWQSRLGSHRHNADYDTHKATLWNISTFGATPYSEKRATTVFLAPAGWTPQVYQTTRMMPYVGAYATSPTDPQPWLQTSAVALPPDAPPLPARFIF
ncbi:hypothetical protein [Longimicrobium sp.]|jgi:hypothetical protein|uniref:hypothetical protein n=1 Tax=Longimicrobium sp. TaxID=2029185 RepID=UPI002F93D0C5